MFAHFRTRFVRVILSAGLAVVAVGAATPAARADSMWEYLLVIAGARSFTYTGEWTEDQEQAAIEQAWQQYKQQHQTKPKIGQNKSAGYYPTNRVPPGASTTLQFTWINPVTGAEIAPTDVDHVEYWVNTDPFNPGQFDYAGVSYDAGSLFSFTTTNIGFEPVFLSQPYGFNGQPIWITGVDGFNVAQGIVTNLIPEPASLGVLALGGLPGLRRRR